MARLEFRQALFTYREYRLLLLSLLPLLPDSHRGPSHRRSNPVTPTVLLPTVRCGDSSTEVRVGGLWGTVGVYMNLQVPWIRSKGVP